LFLFVLILLKYTSPLNPLSRLLQFSYPSINWLERGKQEARKKPEAQRRGAIASNKLSAIALQNKGGWKPLFLDLSCLKYPAWRTWRAPG
jgi:hypothetical protein